MSKKHYLFTLFFIFFTASAQAVEDRPQFCSKLDLTGVRWPAELAPEEWVYYALSLNITGSFEGRDGWKNIAGNFDGQGLSLGLMQQNLGQGTLQPWLLEMFKLHKSVMASNFSPQNLRNLKAMVDDWQKHSSTEAETDEILFPEKGIPHPYEIDFDPLASIQGSAENLKSVTWAKQNILDSKGAVISTWKKSFQSMAASAEYRSFQLAASTVIFNKAKEYFIFFKFRELRSLLFLFDIVVQNGSIKQQHLNLYNNWLSSNPNASEESQTLALLEARLTTVRPEYVQDVRSRKTALIMGHGVVHKVPRNFPVEYCFNHEEQIL